MKRFPFLIVFLVLAANVIAAPPPPDYPSGEVTWRASLSRAPTKGLTLGRLHVRFEETTLAQVGRAASTGKIAHRGDAGESVYWLCYTIPTAPIAQRLWLVCNGEMGGSEHAVTEFDVTKIDDARPKGDCPLLPSKLQPVAMDIPAWLGASDTEIRNLLGKPSHAQGPWQTYNWQAKIPGKCEGGYDLKNWLWIKFDKGRAISINAGQVSSC